MGHLAFKLVQFVQLVKSFQKEWGGGAQAPPPHKNPTFSQIQESELLAGQVRLTNYRLPV